MLRMAELAPFRGVLYDPARVSAAKVIAPPYDVIDAAERKRLADADPHNVVRLILPEPDGELDRYGAAAKTFDAWQAAGVLRRDQRRAFYRYHQVFRHDDLGDREIVRAGFIAAVKLVPLSERVILPHERTLSGPKEDRLALMKATSAHFSQIFTMFRDSSGEVERMFRRYEREAPVVDARTADGTRHLLWRVDDAELFGKLRHHMSPKKLYIADGHHRYETMLALRDQLAAAAPLSQYSAAQYGTMFLCASDQPGLVVLPTHRILHSLQGFSAATLLERASELFIVDRIDNGAGNAAAIRAAMASAVAHQPTFAAVFPGDPHAWRFTLAPSANAVALGMATPAVAKLDVTLLHNLVFERLLGITPAQQGAQTNLRYVKETSMALEAAASADCQAVFMLGPSSVEQVMHVADLGEVMPQKSTYFFPKIASGLVMNKLDRDEDLI